LNAHLHLWATLLSFFIAGQIMTEYELLYLIIERRNEAINLLQWWGAISVGVIVASHFAGRTLNIFIITLMISFYVFFSLFVIRMADALFDQLLMAFSDLVIYAEQAAAISNQAKAVIQVHLTGRLSQSAIYLSVVFYGLSIGTCSYPIWRYLKMRRLGVTGTRPT